MSPTVSFAGIPLAGYATIPWGLQAGTEPYMSVIEVQADEAQKIMGQLKGVSGILNLNGTQYQGVYVLSTKAGSRPQLVALHLADLRWKWDRIHIVRDYNRRRRTGQVRMIGERVEIQQPSHDVEYAPWSLDNGAPWTPKRILEDVLEHLGVKKYVLPDTFERKIQSEDISLDDAGNAAMARVLQFLGGYNLYVAADQTVVVYDTLSFDESKVVQQAKVSIIQGTGSWTVSDRRFLRPAKVYVGFDRECELRLSYDEEAAFAATQPPSSILRNSPTREPLDLENIAYVPLPSMTVGSRTVGRGTPITIKEYLDAISGTEVSQAPGPLTIDQLRRYFYKPTHYVNSLYTWVADQVDRTWANHIRALQRGWRIQYRLCRPWMDKIRSIRANRIAIEDVETGVRAPSVAYMDYTVKPSQLAIATSIFGRPMFRLEDGWEITGYDDRLANAYIAPATVRVRDPEIGLIDVQLHEGPYGMEDQLIPGKFTRRPLRMPCTMISDALSMWLECVLTATFKVSIVVTVTQAAPNAWGRLHEEAREAADVAGILGLDDLGECEGPDYYIRITPTDTTTARFAWDDDRADDIRESFYSGLAMPKDLLVNKEEVEALADAAAAWLYSRFLDRPEGSFQTHFDSGAEIQGTVTQIEHTVNRMGSIRTQFTIPGTVQPMDLLTYLPEGVRRKIMRMVER